MNARHGIRLALALAVCALLAACAAAPPKPQPKPAVVIAQPEPPSPTLTPTAPAPVVAPDEPWASLTASFAMQDCTDASLVRAREAMFTRSPAHFEQLLRQSLPLMMYVQKQLQAAGLPGEFAMLPMLESSYNPSERSRHGDPAGMWQMMPRTARAHGIVIDRHYDGRRDPVASTRAAIEILTALEQQFGDWRLTDMAYNAGRYAVLGALRRHPDLGDGAIPDIPVGSTTRNHLAKLMALSCILREPERFHVELPQPAANHQLMTLQVPAETRLRNAADMAEIPETNLRKLNPGYLGASVPADSPRTLLLPSHAAQSLAAALTVDASESVAQVDSMPSGSGSGNNVPLPREPASPPRGDDAPASAPAKHHRVRKGETLWSIAHHYHVTVSQLKRWNHLHDDTLHPGETLRLED
jgi:membrane-bound lytic murein transglycosylase D